MSRKLSLVVVALAASTVLTACHPRVEPGSDMDKQMNCSALNEEIQKTQGVRAKIAKSRGFSMRNVGLGLIFWPGIVLNEVTGESAQTEADARLTHLKNIYAQQCSADCVDVAAAERKGATEIKKQS